MLRPFFEEERDFFKRWYANHPEELNACDCATDIYEDNGDLIVEMHVPGMNNEHISIEVIDEDKLKITGEKESCTTKENADFHRKEIKCGNFEEILELPADVIAEQATAEVQDGVLFVRLPIKEEKKSNVKTIMIKNRK